MAELEMQLGLSSCPNDTFIFHALLHGLVDGPPIRWQPVIADVEALNERALAGELAVTKLSFHAFMQVRDRYALLDSGAAFGFGCGPLLVARRELAEPAKARIAVPGLHTTACLLLKAWNPALANLLPMRFDQILPAVQSGQVEAGVIIHEGRFVYPNYQCVKLVDLGEWWERETGLPVPLGCIAARRDRITTAYHEPIETAIRASLLYARRHPEASRQFVRRLAGELDERVIAEHIRLYVNDYSLSLGEAGRRAMARLEELLHG